MAPTPDYKGTPMGARLPYGMPTMPSIAIMIGGSPGKQDCDPDELLDLPDIRQPDNYSCGACCAMSCGQYRGVGPDTIAEWKQLCKTSVQYSTEPADICRVLRDLGLDIAEKHGMAIDDLCQCWCDGNPVICCIQEYGTPSKRASFAYGHYVAVIGVDLGLVFVQDPSIDNVMQGQGADMVEGIMPILCEKWMEVWHDKDAQGKEYKQYGIIVGTKTGTAGTQRNAQARGS
jgi:hypothetical protein